MERRTTWSWIGAGAAAISLLAGVFAAGLYVGSDLTGRIHGAYVLPRASAQVSVLQGQLLLLDRGDGGALREQLNMLMDGELLTTCRLLKEEPGRSSASEPAARAIVRRVAEYRKDHAVTYPEVWAKDSSAAMESPRKIVAGCLASSLEVSAK